MRKRCLIFSIIGAVISVICAVAIGILVTDTALIWAKKLVIILFSETILSIAAAATVSLINNYRPLRRITFYLKEYSVIWLIGIIIAVIAALFLSFLVMNFAGITIVFNIFSGITVLAIGLIATAIVGFVYSLLMHERGNEE